MNNRLAIDSFMPAKGPLVDVRSPSEFAKAHWPGAVNLPLFDDEGRAEVGTLYKQQGRQQAIQRGLELVGPKLAAMGEQLQQIAQQGPGGLRIYCWRGGMRSGSVAWLASTLDLEVVVLEGGYKSFRRWVLSQFERSWPLQLLGAAPAAAKPMFCWPSPSRAAPWWISKGWRITAAAAWRARATRATQHGDV